MENKTTVSILDENNILEQFKKKCEECDYYKQVLEIPLNNCIQHISYNKIIFNCDHYFSNEDYDSDCYSDTYCPVNNERFIRF
jgi:hypothetical protein